MSAINESLDRVLNTAGTRMVTLIDIGTGMIIASAGDDNMDLQRAAVSLADEARWAIRTHRQDTVDGAATVAAFAANRLCLTKILEYQRGDGLLLYVDVDLSQTNAALATLQIDQLSAELLTS